MFYKSEFGSCLEFNYLCDNKDESIMKKIVSILLFVSIAFFVNAYDFEVDGLCYNFNSDSTSVIVTYKEYSNNNYSGLTTINIPASIIYNGTSFSVTEIGFFAFNGCSGLTSVTIPNSMTYIRPYAFRSCTGLTSITIPNSVTLVDALAFEGCTCLNSVIWNAKTCSDYYYSDHIPFKDCTNIQSFVFGNEVEKIPANLCYGLTGLTYVIIGNSVTSIGEGAFFGCAGITSVTWNAKSCNDFADNSPFGGSINIQSFSFGNEVKSIPTCLCRGLTGLTSVTIPNSVISIGSSAFAGCTGLSSITIPNLVTEICSSTFWNCSSLTSVTIPNSVTLIGNSAFYGCTGLNTAIIGENVTSIGTAAFKNCSLLENLVALRERPIVIPSNTFEGVPTASCDLHVRQGSKIRYENQDVWKDFLIIVEDAEDWADVSGGGSGSGIYGDVNGDGIVSSVDITIIYNILLGQE